MLDWIRSLISRPNPEVSADDIVRAELSLDILARDILQVAKEETVDAPVGAKLTTILAEEHRRVDHTQLFANIEQLASAHDLQVVNHDSISYTFKKIK